MTSTRTVASATRMENTAYTPTVISTSTPEIIAKICPKIKKELPAEDVKGSIILNGAYLTYDKSLNHYVLNPDGAYLWNLETNTKIEMFRQDGEEFRGFSVSPDHNWLVHSALTYDGTSQRITVMDVKGKIIRNVVDADGWLDPISWLDEEHIAISTLNYSKDGPPFPTLIYNPFTKDVKFLQPDYPNIYWWNLPYWESTLTSYDPSASLVLYPIMGYANIEEGVVLWDVNNHWQVNLLPISSPSYVHKPIWSADGQKFLLGVVMKDHQTPELYIGNRDGTLQQLTRFEDLVTTGHLTSFTFSNYSWSSDNRYIAFWYKIDEQDTSQLAILDTKTSQVGNLCVTDSNKSASGITTPIWSPDDAKILVTGFINKDIPTDQYHAILIDIEKDYMVEIAENLIPEGWLGNKP